MSVPHTPCDDACFTLAQVKDVLFTCLELSSKKDVKSAFEQIQKFILFGMHLPLVTDPGRLDREDTHPAPFELHGEESNGGDRTRCGSRCNGVHGPKIGIRHRVTRRAAGRRALRRR